MPTPLCLIIQSHPGRGCEKCHTWQGFWVCDRSAEQRRTAMLLDKTLRMIAITLRLAGLPFLRPIHRLAAELLEAIYGEP